MLYFFVMLDLNSCSVVYLEQVRQILSLHLKIPPPAKDWLSLAAAHVGDRVPTFLCPATVALPCWDSTTPFGWFPSPSLGQRTASA